MEIADKKLNDLLELTKEYSKESESVERVERACLSSSALLSFITCSLVIALGVNLVFVVLCAISIALFLIGIIKRIAFTYSKINKAYRTAVNDLTTYDKNTR